MAKNNTIKCPNCNSTNCVKNGKVNGRQTYLCKECYSRFLVERNKKRYPASLKKEAIKLYKEGKTLTEIANILNIKVQTIHYWIKHKSSNLENN